MKSLLNVINSYTPLDEEMERELANAMIKKTMPAGEYLLKAEQVSSFIFFIETGSVFCYKVDEGGKERVVNFIFEEDLFCDLESYVTEMPSDFYMKTLEPSVIYFIGKRHFDTLLEKDLRWERIMRLVMQDAFIRMVNDRKYMRTLSNTEHYVKLVESHPNLLNRVPLYLIASYLNITPEGLSKIRRRITDK